MSTIHTPESYDFIEKSRSAVLTAGYQFVAWKTSVKRNLGILRTKIILFYS